MYTIYGLCLVHILLHQKKLSGCMEEDMDLHFICIILNDLKLLEKLPFHVMNLGKVEGTQINSTPLFLPES